MFLQTKDLLLDREVIDKAKTDMAYKYFLDLNPKDNLPNYSLLSVFRNTKIKDETILEEMLKDEKIKEIQSEADKDVKLSIPSNLGVFDL